MPEVNYNPKITVEIDIRETTDIELDLHTVMHAINELPLTGKWNLIAGILNNIDPDVNELTEDQTILIGSFLEKQMKRFATKQ